jgi:hypothetical protein
MTQALSQTRSRLLLTAASLLVFGAGCSPADATVEVVAFLDESGPLVNLEITALPFDPAHILDSLASASPTPKPSFPELEAEMAAYRRPDATQLREIGTAWRVTRDSVARLADSLRLLAPDSPGYSQAYERLRSQYQRLAQRAVERDAQFRAQVGEDRDLALRASAAADSLRAWEQIAYADFPVLVDSVVARTGHEPQTAVTDEHGVAALVLPPGAWWLVAAMANRDNPFIERHWNVGLTVSAFGPTKIPLFDRNGATRWRH